MTFSLLPACIGRIRGDGWMDINGRPAAACDIRPDGCVVFNCVSTLRCGLAAEE